MLIFCVSMGFFALGIAFSEVYNKRMWDKYLDGMRNGVSMKEWKEEGAVGARTVRRAAAKKGM